MADENIQRCFVCKVEEHTLIPSDQGVIVNCPRCGKYKAPRTDSDLFLQKIRKEDQTIKISGWVSDENRKGLIPLPTIEVLSPVIRRPIPTVTERADRFLLEALRKLESLGSQFRILEPRFIAATYSRDIREVEYLCEVLVENDYVKRHRRDGFYSVRPQGHTHAQKIRQAVGVSRKGFVAMWFDKIFDEIYEQGFASGIRKAGYDPVRIDRKEHINKIDDEIIAEIRSSAFVVADFTGHRGGVYFEAGFALGLNLPVIWTCREDNMEDLHFDIQQYNMIDWVDATDLARRLEKRILATIVKNPHSV